MNGEPAAPSRRVTARLPGRVVGLGLLLLASGIVCVISLWRGWVRPDTLQALVASSGAAGRLVYVGGVVLLELLWMPRLWGLLAGGMLFGPVTGAALSIGGDLAGASICYLLARGAGRDWVLTLLEPRPRSRRVVEIRAERRGLLTLALLRACPIAHFTLVSYAAGLTGVRPAAFLVGTGLGMLPGAVVYPLLGQASLRPGGAFFFGALAAVAVMLGLTLWAGRRLIRA